jgi:hypothetical protein
MGISLAYSWYSTSAVLFCSKKLSSINAFILIHIKLQTKLKI